MNKMKALKTLMIALGISYLCIPTLYMLFAPDYFKWAPFSQPYQSLIIAIYASLGICLLVAARNPLSHLIIVDFTILSSVFSGAVMTYNALFAAGEGIHLFIDVPLSYLIALAFILLYPRRTEAINEEVSRSD